MKHNRMVKWVTCLTAALIAWLNAYGQLSVEAQIRPRAEVRYGYKSLLTSDETPGSSVSQRSRLTLINRSEDLDWKISIQDIRTWGDEQLYSATAVNGDAASLDLHEAFFIWKTARGLNMQVGRSEWRLGNQRLLAARNWNQHGMSYDGVLMNYSINKFAVKLAGSWNAEKSLTEGNYYTADKLKTLNFLNVTSKPIDDLSISGLAVVSGKTASDDDDALFLKNTVGGNVKYKKSIITANLEGYSQTGEENDGNSVAAWMVGAGVDVKLGKIKIIPEITILSGHDSTASGDGTYHNFDILYGGRHRFYGYMDYFGNPTKTLRRGGLVDIALKAEGKVTGALTMIVHYHNFRLQQAVYSPVDGTLLDKHLGNEIDLVLKYTINDKFVVETGYCYLVPGDNLETLQNRSETGGSNAQWVYLQLTVKSLTKLSSN